MRLRLTSSSSLSECPFPCLSFVAFLHDIEATALNLLCEMSLSLSQPLDHAEKLAIVQCFWRKDPPDLTRYEPYFDFYRIEAKALCVGLDNKDHMLERMAAKTHKDIRLIAEKLAEWQDSDLATLTEEVEKLFPIYRGDLVAIRLSICFALRVRLMLNVREPQDPIFVGGTPKIQWHLDRLSLATFVGLLFPQADDVLTSLPLSESTLDSKFTAANLERLYGVSIRWTHCLADHLRFDPETMRLFIFSHKICLYDFERDFTSSVG